MFTVQDIEIETETEIENEKMQYMKDTVQSIINLDIKNFNYIIFEEDIDNMYKKEFEYFFDKFMLEILNKMNEYIYIDTSLIQYEEYRIKQIFTKNIIRFYMNTLPYVYLKGILEKKNIDGLHDALDLINENSIQLIIDSIQDSYSQYESFNVMMNEIEDTINNEKQRNAFNTKLTLLDQNMNKKLKLVKYHESIIIDSGQENLQKLLKQYLINDKENILS